MKLTTPLLSHLSNKTTQRELTLTTIPNWIPVDPDLQRWVIGLLHHHILNQKYHRAWELLFLTFYTSYQHKPHLHIVADPAGCLIRRHCESPGQLPTKEKVALTLGQLWANLGKPWAMVWANLGPTSDQLQFNLGSTSGQPWQTLGKPQANLRQILWQQSLNLSPNHFWMQFSNFVSI